MDSLFANLSDAKESGQGAQEASGSLKMALDNPDMDKWLKWHCPDCGEEMAHPKRIPFGEEEQLCYDCLKNRRSEVSAPRPVERRVALERYGVPAKYAAAFVEPAAWPVDGRRPGFSLADWKGSPWCITLAGVVDGGKTMMATELFYRNLPRVRSASWWRAATAVRTIFGGFGEQEAKACNEQVFRSELLVLDEIGRGHDGRAWGLIVEIISERHDHQFPTLVTTNRRLRAEPGDKEKGLSEEDPALYRRLKEGFIGGFTEPWKPPVKA